MAIVVGVLLPKPCQLLDFAGPIDLLNMVTNEYLSSFPGPTPPNLLDIQTLYISDTLEPVHLTANIDVVPTHTFDACPKLNILFVPGPPDGYVPPADLAAFVKSRAGEVDFLLADCSGPLILAELGLLDGKHATVNKEAIPMALELFPKVQWETKQRWVVDNNLWTAGGALAGLDMMAAFIRRKELGLGEEVVALCERIIEFDARKQDYN